MVVKPWNQRRRAVREIVPEVQAGLSNIPGMQIFAAQPPALPGGSNFPVEFLLLSTDEPKQMLAYAQQLQQKAMESGLFYFPPQIDLKIDQPAKPMVGKALPEGPTGIGITAKSSAGMRSEIAMRASGS